MGLGLLDSQRIWLRYSLLVLSIKCHLALFQAIKQFPPDFYHFSRARSLVRDPNDTLWTRLGVNIVAKIWGYKTNLTRSRSDHSCKSRWVFKKVIRELPRARVCGSPGVSAAPQEAKAKPANSCCHVTGGWPLSGVGLGTRLDP